VEDVLRAIPHRPPFLFVDEIIEIDQDRILARRTIRADEPYFKGHYPGNPLMPGVLLCESVIQAGAIMLSRRIEGGAGKVPILTRIQNAKFKRQVRPGDVVDLEAKFRCLVYKRSIVPAPRKPCSLVAEARHT